MLGAARRPVWALLLRSLSHVIQPRSLLRGKSCPASGRGCCLPCSLGAAQRSCLFSGHRKQMLGHSPFPFPCSFPCPSGLPARQSLFALVHACPQDALRFPAWRPGISSRLSRCCGRYSFEYSPPFFPTQGAQGTAFPWFLSGDTASAVCQPGLGTIVHGVPATVTLGVLRLDLA